MITFVKALEIIIKEINLEKIMIETDAPYLAPVPFRGKTNQPAYVEEIAKKIAEIKKIDVEEVIKQTSENACLLFKKLSNSISQIEKNGGKIF